MGVNQGATAAVAWRSADGLQSSAKCGKWVTLLRERSRPLDAGRVAAGRGIMNMQIREHVDRRIDDS